MKLTKILITTALLLTTINVIPSIASVAIPAAHERLNTQHLDTTKNIDHFGYQHKASKLGRGAVVDKFTFTPEVLVNILDTRFNPSTASEENKKTSTKNTKKLLQDIVTKALNMFDGDSVASKRALFLAALQEKGSVVVDVAALGFNKELPPVEAVSTNGATALFNELKTTNAVKRAKAVAAAIAAKRQAGATSAGESLTSRAGIATAFATAMIDLYKDGVLTDSSVDTSRDPVAAYPHIIESIKRLGALQSELTGELARLIKEASSPARKSTPSTPSTQHGSGHHTPASTGGPGGSSSKNPRVVESSIFDD